MKIDHHLQQLILQKLTANDSSMRYTDLKEGDIENSLFSYHLNKLIDQGMVEKHDNGYTVSIDGARWLNDNGMAIRQKEAPRVFIALIVQNEDGEYMVGQRLGQMKTTINDYLTPSVAYSNENDLSNQVEYALDKFVPAGHLIDHRQYGFVQIKASYRDDNIMRVLFYVTEVKVVHFEAVTKKSVVYEWMNLESISAIDHPSARILRGLIDYISSAKNGSSPIIAG